MQKLPRRLRWAAGRNGPFRFSSSKTLRANRHEMTVHCRSVELLLTSSRFGALPLPFQRCQSVFLIAVELEVVWRSNTTDCFQTTAILRLGICEMIPSSDQPRSELRSTRLGLREMNPDTRAGPKRKCTSARTPELNGRRNGKFKEPACGASQPFILGLTQDGSQAPQCSTMTIL